jgi:hypothetical protein
VAGLFGKQRRQYGLEDPAGIGTALFNGYCDPLFGFKGGVLQALGKSGWAIAPAIGVAVNTDESKRSSVFADIPLNYVMKKDAFVGTGITLWDFNHSDKVTAGWLVDFGVPLWQNAVNKHSLLFTGEGRLFFDHIDTARSNYQFWGGLTYLFK